MDRIIQVNGLTRTELLLLRPFVRQPWKEFTVSDMKHITGNRSHHYVFEALKKFTALRIIEEQKRGNTNIYRVNYDNNPNLDFLVMAEYSIRDERRDIPFNILAKITNRLRNPFYVLMIGGSYVEKKQKVESDLDMAIIIPNSEQKKKYEIALKEGELTIPEIHGLVFTQEEFYQMLINKEFNYGKELARKHILVSGAEHYFKILFEAMRYGFKG
ncbi:MAG: nucleotidyltransferase domain-containing protein [Candidatus Woesearchaeota archaeon]